MNLHCIRPQGLGSTVSRARGLVMASGLALGMLTLPALAQPNIDNSPLLQERERQEAQEREGNRNIERQGSTQDGQRVMEFHIWESLHGRDIVDSMNDKVGEIGDLIVDRRSGRVEYVVVHSGGFLSIGQREVAVDFDRLTFRSGTDQAFVVPMTREELQGMKEFDPETFLTRTNDQTWEQSISIWESDNPVQDIYKSYDPYRASFSTARPVTVQGKVIAVERMTHQRLLHTDDGVTGRNDADRTTPQRTDEPNRQADDRARQQEQARQEEQRRAGDPREGKRDRQVDGRTALEDEVIVMTLQTGDGSNHQVVTGPVWYMEKNSADMQVGQNVILHVVPHMRGGSTVLVASSARVGDREMTLRDADGRPAWDAEQAARDAARDTARWENEEERTEAQREANDRRDNRRPGQNGTDRPMNDRPAGEPDRREVQNPDRREGTDRRDVRREGEVDRQDGQDGSWTNQGDGMTRMVLLSDVVGRDVSSMTEDDIGDITGAIIERNSGMVPFLVLNADQTFLGIGGTDRIVPWKSVMLTGDDVASISASKQVITNSREMPDDINTLSAPGVIDQIYGNFSVQRDAFLPRSKERGLRNQQDGINPARRTDGMPRDKD